jgi:uncharacterized protein (TIGR02271 family)
MHQRDQEKPMSWLSQLEVGMPVYATDGMLGSIVSVPRVDLGDPTAPAEVIVLASPENTGPGVEEFRRFSRDMVDRVETRGVHLNLARAEVPSASAAVAAAHRRLRPNANRLHIPLAEERVEIDTRVRELGYVEVRKKVEEYLDERVVPLRHQQVHVERVVVDEVIPEVIGPYMDGDVYVVPVIEEEVVVTTRLRLKEELRIHRTLAEHEERVQTPFRRERLVLREHWYDPEQSSASAIQERNIDGLDQDTIVHSTK